jgi:ADP-dependent NAD(P)H-hydrate dehydratase
MIEPADLDIAWLTAHPLPAFDGVTDKSRRGQALIVGGGPSAPAAPMLTAEAALRAGCGRARIGVAAAMVPHIAAHLPEAGYVALPLSASDVLDQGAADVLAESAMRADAVAIGPGMSDRAATAPLVEALIALAPDSTFLLDAAACACAGPLHAHLAAHRAALILTPHPGEMAELTDQPIEDILADPAATTLAAAKRFDAVVALRSVETWIAAPDGRLLLYRGGCVGLATGGSGDVGVGIVLGLLARGADPFVAAAWGTWVHGEAGRRLGDPGFLARDLLPLVRDLIRRPSAG